MLNIALTNKTSKRKVIEAFMRSRGIDNFIILNDSQELYDSLLIDTCNLHIFDYLFDLSIVNTIRDLRDNASTINVYVTNTENAQPYLALTDNVFVLPDEVSIMSYFWDSPARNVRNILAYEAMGIDNVRVEAPRAQGATKRLAVEISTKDLPLKYKTADGRIVTTKGPQIQVQCSTKSFDLKNILKTRDQSEVFSRKKRSLDDLPDAPVEEAPVVQPELKPEPAPKPVEEKPAKTVKEKPAKEKPIKGSADKHANGTSVFFGKVPKILVKEDSELESIEDLVEELEESVIETEPAIEQESDIQEQESVLETIPEPKSEPAPAEPKQQKEYVSFGGFSGGTETRSTKSGRMRKFALSTECDTIAEYLLSNGHISHEDHDRIMKDIVPSRDASRDAQFGDKALADGCITEEQLVTAISAVNRIEVLSWDTISAMELDFSFFTADKCRKFKFFKLDDRSVPDYESDRIQLIVSASISALNPEIKRLFDNPRIRYTLDTYIDRKLEGY